MFPKGDVLKNISRFILLFYVSCGLNLFAYQNVNQTPGKGDDIDVYAENLDGVSVVLGNTSTINDYLAYAAFE